LSQWEVNLLVASSPERQALSDIEAREGTAPLAFTGFLTLKEVLLLTVMCPGKRFQVVT
jgi:hypothetical protein